MSWRRIVWTAGLVTGACSLGCGIDSEPLALPEDRSAYKDSALPDTAVGVQGLPATTLDETLAGPGDFETFLRCLKAAGMSDVFEEGKSYTVLAPTTGAFGKLPEGTIDQWLAPENAARLGEILRCHVVEGRMSSQELVAAGEVATIQGRRWPVKDVDGVIHVGEARIRAADIGCSDGVIHAVDVILMPDEPTTAEEADVGGEAGEADEADAGSAG